MRNLWPAKKRKVINVSDAQQLPNRRSRSAADAEIRAMVTIERLMRGLDEVARHRVFAWMQDRFATIPKSAALECKHPGFAPPPDSGRMGPEAGVGAGQGLFGGADKAIRDLFGSGGDKISPGPYQEKR